MVIHLHLGVRTGLAVANRNLDRLSQLGALDLPAVLDRALRRLGLDQPVVARAHRLERQRALRIGLTLEHRAITGQETTRLGILLACRQSETRALQRRIRALQPLAHADRADVHARMRRIILVPCAHARTITVRRARGGGAVDDAVHERVAAGIGETDHRVVEHRRDAVHGRGVDRGGQHHANVHRRRLVAHAPREIVAEPPGDAPRSRVPRGLHIRVARGGLEGGGVALRVGHAHRPRRALARVRSGNSLEIQTRIHIVIDRPVRAVRHLAVDGLLQLRRHGEVHVPHHLVAHAHDFLRRSDALGNARGPASLGIHMHVLDERAVLAGVRQGDDARGGRGGALGGVRVGHQHVIGERQIGEAHLAVGVGCGARNQRAVGALARVLLDKLEYGLVGARTIVCCDGLVQDGAGQRLHARDGALHTRRVQPIQRELLAHGRRRVIQLLDLFGHQAVARAQFLALRGQQTMHCDRTGSAETAVVKRPRARGAHTGRQHRRNTKAHERNHPRPRPARVASLSGARRAARHMPQRTARRMTRRTARHTTRRTARHTTDTNKVVFHMSLPFDNTRRHHRPTPRFWRERFLDSARRSARNDRGGCFVIPSEARSLSFRAKRSPFHCHSERSEARSTVIPSGTRSLSFRAER